MMRALYLISVIAISSLLTVRSLACDNSRAIVLVPGTLNSAVPGSPEDPYKNFYYSQAITSTVAKQFCDFYVVKGLSWFGDFQNNGEVVFNELTEWQNQNPHLKDKPLDVIAHSAGGFYSLFAAHQNAKLNSPLKFRKMHFISTPLHGLELANILTANPLVKKQMERLFNRVYSGLDLRGLWQLQTDQTERFLGQLEIPETIEIHTYAGSQSAPSSWKDEFASPFLPPVFQAFEFLIDGPSDGIVSVDSAYWIPVLKTTNSGILHSIFPHREITLPLDHVEEVWDSSYLEYLGFKRTDHVSREQTRLIESILKD